MTRDAITAVGVLVPAHDEASSIGACVRSVLTALDAVPGPMVRALCVLADRCTDTTADRARAAVADHPAAVVRVRTEVLETGAGTVAPQVGALRATAARTVLQLLGTTPATTWLLSTDADGTVTPGWVTGHLALADAGADAVAGGVVLDLPGFPCPPGEPPEPDHPVYAANLGIRADAFGHAGGFPALACGEDHGMVARLRAAGFRVVPGVPGTVRTSPRHRGRARGGLADRLRQAAETGVAVPDAGSRVT